MLIDRVCNNPLVKRTPLCRQPIEDAMSFHLVTRQPSSVSNEKSIYLFDSSGGIAVINNANHKLDVRVNELKRKFYDFAKFKRTIYAFSEGLHVSMFDHKSDLWWTDSKMKISNIHQSCPTSIENCIFLARFRYYANKGVYCYNTKTNTLTKMAPFLTARHDSAIIALNMFVYAIGGVSIGENAKFLNTVEKYDPQSKTWSFVTPMRYSRANCGAAILNGKLYVCSGENGTPNHNSAECYDPETRKWTTIAAMNMGRTDCSLVAHQEKLWAIGGSFYNTDGKKFSTEVYDPVTNRWEEVPGLELGKVYSFVL